jgi:hypothetical protein
MDVRRRKAIRPNSRPLFVHRLAYVFVWYLWIRFKEQYINVFPSVTQSTSWMPVAGRELSHSAVCVQTVRSEQKPELVFHFFGHSRVR